MRAIHLILLLVFLTGCLTTSGVKDTLQKVEDGRDYYQTPPTSRYVPPETEPRPKSNKGTIDGNEEEIDLDNGEDDGDVKNDCPKNGVTTISDEGERLASDVGDVVPKIKDSVCANFEKVLSQIPEESHDAVKQAYAYRIKNAGNFKNNPGVISVADYSLRSTKERFYQIDIFTGKVTKRKVSHGRNSDSRSDSVNHDGYMTQCKKNGSRTNTTRPGFFKTAETYPSIGSCKETNSEGTGPSTFKIMRNQYGVKPSTHCAHGEFRDKNGNLKWGWPLLGGDYPKGHNALKLDGLVKDVNDEARSKGVVMHGAWYNQGDIMGRSHGCPAFHPDEFHDVTKSIAGGSLYYSYTPMCGDDMKKILAEVPKWKNVCQ